MCEPSILAVAAEVERTGGDLERREPMGAAARALQGVVIAVLGACSATTKPEPEPRTEPAHWEYESKGDPEHWAHLDPRNDVCKSGHYQSPIDLHAVARRLARGGVKGRRMWVGVIRAGEHQWRPRG